ncbi:phosphatase PAP2 family protein [Shewanella algae]|uniref:phosphatase PAP2 family protein n=1 Tax=Shewanella algae TaxID=38313 RepID=UPI001AAE3304|nr:phosphatase PAP2 family protein [Shewanella algae]MBO2662802.1 phosphatase PAP2 family protein [Shewanella algae]MCL1053581.1 phosphatase PAP2 family protein [Shewanella algae]WKC40178.1 phosphatase PAP2 family protein [Shewanella algae]
MPIASHPLSFQHWFKHHLLLPLSVGLGLLILLHITNADLLLAQWMLAFEGTDTAWPWRHAFVADKLLHTGGRDLVVLAAVVLLSTLVLSSFKASMKRWRRPLLMLFISALATVLLVRIGKSMTNVACPWDLSLFGGQQPYLPFPMSLNVDTELGQCFPGGHSSGAFAWVGLYYLALVLKPKWRFKLLGAVLLIGAVFSLCQEFRGAHFLSHDIASALIGWTMATLSYGLAYRPWRAAGYAGVLAQAQTLTQTQTQTEVTR